MRAPAADSMEARCAEDTAASGAEQGLLADGAGSGVAESALGRRWARAVAAAGALAAVAAVGSVVGLRASPAPARAADASGAVGLNGLLDSFTKEMESTSELTKRVSEYPDRLAKLEEELKAVKDEMLRPKTHGASSGGNDDNDDGQGTLRSLLQNGTWQRLAGDSSNRVKMRALLSPDNDMYDGNLCADDEEAHAGLCYKKCSLLTGGDHPIRTSAFSCCRESPCGVTNQVVKFRMCSGFDVAGDSMNGGCPHQKGVCYVDEELLLGRCYKKCSLLTDGEYMFRTAPETCCKHDPKKGAESLLSCMSPALATTKPAFAVGGGEFEYHPAAKALRPHPPRRDAAEDPAVA